jgi:hypothetical protein
VIVEVKHLLIRLLVVAVDPDIASDLPEGEDIGIWGKLDIHDVIVKIDVRGLMNESL